MPQKRETLNSIYVLAVVHSQLRLVQLDNAAASQPMYCAPSSLQRGLILLACMLAGTYVALAARQTRLTPLLDSVSSLEIERVPRPGI